MSNYVLGIDIGSSEIRAVMSKRDDTNKLSVVGIGKVKSNGVKKGIITNIEQATSSIQQAVLEATKMAGKRYDKVIVSLSGAYVKSIKARGTITNPDNEIGIKEIKRVMQVAEDIAKKSGDIPKDYVKLHVLPYNFKVDEQDSIEDPLGMSGEKLEVFTHIIIAPESAIKNLTRAVENAGIKIDNIVLSGYASSISTLTSDEKALGVVLIDMGGSTCDIVIHVGNSLIYNDILSVGSSNITNDLSQAIHTPFPSAEEIKLTYRELEHDGEKTISFPVLGENDTTKEVSLDIILNVIFPRIEETFVILSNKLKNSGYIDKIGAGIVLTGGMVKLDDVKEVAERIFSGSVRVAKPRNITSAISEITRDSANSCVIGLCMYGFGEFTPYEIDSNGELRYKEEIEKFQNHSEDTYNRELDNSINEIEINNGDREKVGDMSLPELPEKMSFSQRLSNLWEKFKRLYS